MQLFDIIELDDRSVTPKYLQLANAIALAVEKKQLGINDVLPSINELSAALDISRDTAEKSYKHLKALGIISSVPGKGFFIAKTDNKPANRIFLLFNKLSAHKKIIYDAFAGELGNDAFIDFFVYNNDFGSFKKILQNSKTVYTHYVIIAHFHDADQNPASLLNGITEGKLILMDKWVEGITRPFGAVYEDFEQDIFDALKAALPRLSGYHTIKLIFPDHAYFPQDIVVGFQQFCRQYAFNHHIVSDIKNDHIQAGEVFVNLMEDDLITLLDKIKATTFNVGSDIGIISYNETPWKEHILQGITTISTDFVEMGKTAAKLVKEGSDEKKAVPFRLTLRPSV